MADGDLIESFTSGDWRVFSYWLADRKNPGGRGRVRWTLDLTSLDIPSMVRVYVTKHTGSTREWKLTVFEVADANALVVQPRLTLTRNTQLAGDIQVPMAQRLLCTLGNADGISDFEAVLQLWYLPAAS